MVEEYDTARQQYDRVRQEVWSGLALELTIESGRDPPRSADSRCDDGWCSETSRSTQGGDLIVYRLTMKGFSPKVLVIEEAGQVLEPHIIAALYPSVQHVIALGDPEQLRPQIDQHGG